MRALLIVAIAAVVGVAVASPLGDAGADLAHQLGLDDPAEAQRAVEELSTGQRLGLTPDEPVDEELLAKKQAASASGSPQEALRSLTQLVKELDAQVKQIGGSNSLLALTAETHLDRANVLVKLNKPIEALVEAQKVRAICSRARCSPQVNANNVIHSVEDQLASNGPQAVFGLPAGATAAQASKVRKQLLLLVHPDKNRDADKQTSNYLQHLYDKIEAAYKSLSS